MSNGAVVRDPEKRRYQYAIALTWVGSAIYPTVMARRLLSAPMSSRFLRLPVRNCVETAMAWTVEWRGKVLRTTVGPVPHVAVSAGGLPPGLRPSNFVQPLREAYCSPPDSKQTFLCTYLWAVLLAGMVLDSTLG